MVVGEAIFISILGGFCGYVIIQIPMTLNQTIAHLGAWQVLASSLTNLLYVLGSAVTIAAVFSLYPAWRMAVQTVMEVLRHD